MALQDLPEGKTAQNVLELLVQPSVQLRGRKHRSRPNHVEVDPAFAGDRLELKGRRLGETAQSNDHSMQEFDQ